MPCRLLSTLLFLLVAGTVATPAAAQYQWREANGRMVYSDLPPPPSVPPSAILKSPHRPAAAASADAPAERTEGAAAASAAARAPAAAKTTADREFDYRKRQLERAEADKKAAEQQARAQRAAAACEESKGEVRTLESGMRVASVNDRGERVVADDSDRNRRLESARQAVKEFCKG